MPDWKFALERMTDAVRSMRNAQKKLKHSPSATTITHARSIESRVDELVLEATEFLNRDNLPAVPPLTPDPIDLPPIPLPVPLVEDEQVPVPLPLVEQFGIPEIPPPEIPPIDSLAPGEVDQKRSRRRGGQHGGG